MLRSEDHFLGGFIDLGWAIERIAIHCRSHLLGNQIHDELTGGAKVPFAAFLVCPSVLISIPKVKNGEIRS